ncbi:MAG TPA: helix-turn-helix domain-containing protein [Ktedonobacterales bacterium]|nr:helix-turn-helix domain-containing protein [Ktedonobacterales bacterium]
MAMAVIMNKATEEQYLTLVRAFPLVSIRNDKHLDEAITVINKLLDIPDRSEAEEEYLMALTDLVEIYENAHVEIPPVSGVDLLRYLMEENGLTQADLVPDFGTRSIVSEVLSGKRRLALTHIARLAERFGVPADVFIG